MPVSRGRGGRRRKPRARAHPGQRFDRLRLPRYLMGVLASNDLTTALDAEIEVSMAFGVAYANTDWPRTDAVEELADDLLLGAVTDRGRPGARELLETLASVGPDEVADQARELTALPAGDEPPASPWTKELGTWVCQEAFRVVDDFGDAEHWGAVFATPRGDGRHLLMWLVDNTANGQLDDIIVDPGADDLLGQLPALAEQEDVRIVPADPAQLHAVVASAMQMTDSTYEPPESKDYPRYRGLTISRLRCLPPAVPLTQPLDEDERGAIIDGFLGSAYSQQLLHPADDGEAPEDQVVRFVARLALDHAIDYTGGEPLRLSPATVELFMTQWVPRKAMLDPDDVAWLPDVLRAWIRYAYDQTGRPEVNREETLATVELCTPQFVRLIGSGEGRGFAGQLLAGFLDQGVDIADPEQLDAAIKRYNDSLGES